MLLLFDIDLTLLTSGGAGEAALLAQARYLLHRAINWLQLLTIKPSIFQCF